MQENYTQVREGVRGEILCGSPDADDVLGDAGRWVGVAVEIVNAFAAVCVDACSSASAVTVNAITLEYMGIWPSPALARAGV